MGGEKEEMRGVLLGLFQERVVRWFFLAPRELAMEMVFGDLTFVYGILDCMETNSV